MKIGNKLSPVSQKPFAKGFLANEALSRLSYSPMQDSSSTGNSVESISSSGASVVTGVKNNCHHGDHGGARRRGLSADYADFAD